MQKTHRQSFPKSRPLVGLFAVLLALLVLGMVAVATSQASAHAILLASPVAQNDDRIQERVTEVENPEWLLEEPQFRYANTRSAPQFSQTATHGDNSPYTLLRALANDWVIKWRTVSSPTIYLPYVTHIFTQPATMSLAERIGFGLTSSALAPYTDVTTLGAGWYLDWRVREQPERPAGMDYVQMVRVHQELSCGDWHHGDRAACPYAEPLNYRFRPSASTIAVAAKANPGALWLIGNEMDRKDWSYCIEWSPPPNTEHCEVVGHSGQDEMLPATYAVAYHDLYGIIKAADPSARVAIGGIIQPTPIRLTYLTAIWDAYQATYSETMPVDVWNVHNFIIREKKDNWGADIPPGVDVAAGEYVLDDSAPQPYHIDMAIFQAQIVAFRQWMKEHGQQNKPLVVSEYGVLFSNELIGSSCTALGTACVQDFMVATFDFFATAKDCNLGYVADQCRLVQQWNWYSLDDTWGSFNIHSRLFDPNSKQITETGIRFREYLAQQQ